MTREETDHASSAPLELEVVSREPAEPRPGRPPLLFVHGLAGAAWVWDEAWFDRAAAGWAVDPPVLAYGAQHDQLVPRGDADRTAAYFRTSCGCCRGPGIVMLDAERDAALDIVLADLAAALELDSNRRN